MLEDEDLILLEDGHCLREHALAACGLAPPRPHDEETFAATSLPTLVQMVGSGLGVSFLPAMAVDAGLADGAAGHRAAPGRRAPDAARSSSPGAPAPAAPPRAACWPRC